MTFRLSAALVALLIWSWAPALAQDSSLFSRDDNGDGMADGYEDRNGNGVPDGFESGSQSPVSRLEGEGMATARPGICLSYFQLYCSNYGFPLACTMAGLGNTCTAGDQQACQYFVAIIEANRDCAAGNPNACAYIAQQPMLRQ